MYQYRALGRPIRNKEKTSNLSQIINNKLNKKQTNKQIKQNAED